METKVKDELDKLVEEAGVEPAPRFCPLTIHMGEPSACIKERCAWFVRNGCAIFHLACSAIEWEKVARDRRNR